MIKNVSWLALFTAFAVSGCDSTDKSATATDTEDGCGVSIDDFYPADESSAYYRTAIELEFSEADDTATVTVSDGSSDVPGSTSWEDEVLTFTPTDPFAPNTDYTVSISYCGGDDSFSFSTTEVGAEVETELAGKTYSLDLAGGEFVEPPNVGSILGQYLTIDVLISVSSVSDGEIQMFGAIGDENSEETAQDMCTESLAFPDAADFSEDPYFQLGPEDTTLSVAGYSATINELMISGAFAPDGSYIQGATLSGSADTRDLEEALFPDEDEGYICNLAVGIGVSCSPCTDGEDFCLSILVRDITAEEVDLTLEEVTMDDICAAVEAGTCAAEDCPADTGM